MSDILDEEIVERVRDAAPIIRPSGYILAKKLVKVMATNAFQMDKIHGVDFWSASFGQLASLVGGEILMDDFVAALDGIGLQYQDVGPEKKVFWNLKQLNILKEAFGIEVQ